MDISHHLIQTVSIVGASLMLRILEENTLFILMESLTDHTEETTAYTIQGHDGKRFGTNDINELHLLGILAQDYRSSPGMGTFSCSIWPQDCSPSGTVNCTKMNASESSMTLFALARAWINERFDSEIFLINSKEIFATGNKGEILVRMNLTANDCLYIATGTTFNVEFLLMINNNQLSSTVIKADTLSPSELQEFQ